MRRRARLRMATHARASQRVALSAFRWRSFAVGVAIGEGEVMLREGFVQRIGVLGLLVALASPAWGWGPQGHEITGAIADRLLDQRAKAAVADLLSGDLDKKGKLSHRTTLEAVSIWADEIRKTPASEPKWHFDNMPACGQADKSQYCPNGQCDTEQIKAHLDVLRDTSRSHRERNETLKWIVHLVGDIHQPLHADDNNDLGGNKVNVALAGFKTKGLRDLHGVWDSEFVQFAMGLEDSQAMPSSNELDALAKQARTRVKQKGQGDPDGWAMDSNSLARSVAYDYPQFACHKVPKQFVVLSEDYQDHASAVVRECLLLGGARLANLLNAAIGNGQ